MKVNLNRLKKTDIYNENFNYFFVQKLNSMTPDQKNLLPKHLSVKIFNRGIDATAETLSFNDRLWILSVLFDLKISIVVESEDGIGKDEFNSALKAQRGDIVNSELLDDLQTKTSFILGDRDLMRSLLYMNHVCSSPIYALIQKEAIPNVNNKKDAKFKASKDKLQTVLKLLKNYEANKRRIASDYGFEPCEWLAILYFSTGEKLGTDFYNVDMLNSYNSSRSNLFTAMKKLYDTGFLERRGKKGEHKYVLTSKGIDVLDKVLERIIMKF